MGLAVRSPADDRSPPWLVLVQVEQVAAAVLEDGVGPAVRLLLRLGEKHRASGRQRLMRTVTIGGRE
jgi:hypothetical protein